MRILQLTSHVDVGGITTYVVTLSETLVRRGHEVTVASGGGQLESRLARSRVAHWTVSLHTSAEFSPAVMVAARRLSRQLSEQRVDVIHAHTRVAQVVAAWLSRRHHIPYVTTWHGFFRNRWGRRLWPCTGALTIAISEPVQRSLREDFHVPESQVRLIPNGVPLEYFALSPSPIAVAAARHRYGISEFNPVIGSLGRLASGPVKGYDRLLSAAAQLMKEFPTLRVVIAGEGPGRANIEAQAQQLGIEDHVHLIGADIDGKMALALMDIFVFPVRANEGFGLALIEAMAAGKPVVATRTGAIPTIVREETDGVLVSEDDPNALVAAIRRLLQDQALAANFGRHAHQRVRDAFDLERVATQVEAVYEECRRGSREKTRAMSAGS